MKYYFFNGMPVARYKANGNNFLYMHADHLGSVALTTYSSSGTVRDSQKYCAYSKQQRSGTTCTSGNDLDTSKHFTGQDYDSTGLHYYRARYYDDHLGAFISPDTIVPDATNLLDYNRYMYVRGRALNMNDPSGHCVNSTTTSKPDEIGYDNSECWRHANTIGAMWDSTDYWSNRFTSKDVFFNNVANNGHNGTDFFQAQLDGFFNSDEGREWLDGIPDIPKREQDFGDYTAISGSTGFLGGALIFDDYGNVYFRKDNFFIGSPGIGLSRGDIGLSNGNWTWTDIDQLGLSRADKAALAPNILIGPSRGGSGGYYFLEAGVAYNLSGPAHITVESGVNSSFASASYSQFSYTFQIYPTLRYK